MEIGQSFYFDDQFKEGFFDQVQEIIKKKIVEKPYNIKSDNIENFINKMFDFENNLSIKTVIENYSKNNDPNGCADEILRMRFKNTKVNFFLKKVQPQFEHLVSFEQFIDIK